MIEGFEKSTGKTKLADDQLDSVSGGLMDWDVQFPAIMSIDFSDLPQEEKDSLSRHLQIWADDPNTTYSKETVNTVLESFGLAKIE